MTEQNPAELAARLEETEALAAALRERCTLLNLNVRQRDTRIGELEHEVAALQNTVRTMTEATADEAASDGDTDGQVA